MTAESQVAFYKATKFWIVFLLALLLAAVLWRVFGGVADGGGGASPTAADRSPPARLPRCSAPYGAVAVSYIR